MCCNRNNFVNNGCYRNCRNTCWNSWWYQNCGCQSTGNIGSAGCGCGNTGNAGNCGCTGSGGCWMEVYCNGQWWTIRCQARRYGCRTE